MFRDINMLNTDDDAMPLTVAEYDSLLYGFDAVVDRAWWELEHPAEEESDSPTWLRYRRKATDTRQIR
jgi:hypothetical protein